MVLGFPANPVVGQSYFVGSKYWTWTGYAWKIDNIVNTQPPSVTRVDGNGAADTDTTLLVAPSKTSSVINDATLNDATLNDATLNDATLNDATLNDATLNDATLNRAILNDGYTEEVFTITDGATVNLDPNNGSIQTWTLGANRTPGQANWAAGQSITLMVDDGSAFTITWTTLAVVWETDGGTAPTLATSGFTVVVLWKVGTTIYGARVGDA
jgi:hypothetical protein